MAASTTSYATQSDLLTYFPEYGAYLRQVPVFGFVETSTGSHSWVKYGLGVTPLMVYFNGQEGTENAIPASERQWNYTAASDILTIYTTTDPNDDQEITVGQDKETAVAAQLVNASAEISAMLDARFPRPLPKNTVDSGTTAQYDQSIIKATCYAYAANSLVAAGEMERAASFREQLTNFEKTGIIDRINAGEWKLSFEIDATEGGIIEVTKAGTMDLVQVVGDWTGAPYERVQVICTTTGAYGTGQFSVKTSSQTALYGTTLGTFTVTGALQDIGNGLKIRFAGSSMTENDRWDIEVYNMGTVSETNPGIGYVEMRR